MNPTETPLRLVIRQRLVVQAQCHSVSARHITVYWCGFAYGPEGLSQQRLFAQLAEAVAAGASLSDRLVTLRGSFFAVVEDTQARRLYAFVDNSGLYTAYSTEDAVSNSFLGLCQLESLQPSDLSREAMLEFLQLGNVYFGETLSPRIRKIRYDEILEFTESGPRTSHQKKGSISIEAPPEYADLFAASESLAAAVRAFPTSIDLTGGFDSRLVVCLMGYFGVSFDTALSGFSGEADERIGREVAGVLGVPFYFTEYEPATIVDDLAELLPQTDGMGGALSTLHRLRQLNEARRQRGIVLVLKGQGGELLKDFFWTQDFPFYRRRHADLAKLHRLRIEFELLSRDYLTDTSYATFQQVRQARLRNLARYTMPHNTGTYDNIYFRERVQTWNSRLISSCQERDLWTHSPLCELELVRIGYAAPRFQRFYSQIQRQHISRYDLRVARVRTTDGTSASARRSDMLLDLLGYTRVKLRKLLNKFGQLGLNRTLFPVKSRLDQEASRRVLASDLAAEALQALQQQQLLRPSTDWSDLPVRFREHGIVLGWLVRQLEKTG